MLRNILAVTALGFALTGCVETTTTTYSSANRNVLIINNSGYTITNFYGSNSGSSSWEEDILGTSTLPSGNSVNINFDDGSGYCTFDFKVVFSDGSVGIEEDINVCTISTYTIG
jgi:hypothetical protein